MHKRLTPGKGRLKWRFGEHVGQTLGGGYQRFCFVYSQINLRPGPKDDRRQIAPPSSLTCERGELISPLCIQAKHPYKSCASGILTHFYVITTNALQIDAMQKTRDMNRENQE
jgi:hypothetical protein